MYSTCLYCASPLGFNQAVEPFPVGRRLAFDPARGRLWVVCRVCTEWNLTPLEERWEAVEACERLFRGTRTRYSTENIGIARVADGVELVRVGKPLRPEVASWRYGDRFGGRRRRALLLGGGTFALSAGLLVGTPLIGLASGVAIMESTFWAVYLHRRRRIAARIPVGETSSIEVRERDGVRALLYPTERNSAGWALRVAHTGGETVFEGMEAIRAAGMILPGLNFGGGSRREVRDAVRRVEEAGSAERLFAEAARSKRIRTSFGAELMPLSEGAAELRLALEMAAHEETEREALAGELEFLRRAWQEAEEIARIADRILVPQRIERVLRSWHRGADHGMPRDEEAADRNLLDPAVGPSRDRMLPAHQGEPCSQPDEDDPGQTLQSR